MTLAPSQIARYTEASNFRLLNYENIAYNLAQVMGENGLVLIFAEDVWNLTCIRNVLWLQRQVYKLSLNGIKATVVVPNHTYDVSSFYMSIPRKILFPILADRDGKIYQAYGIEDAGFVVIDNHQQIRDMWTLKTGIVPHIGDILNTLAD
jgi:peroxiredoxin